MNEQKLYRILQVGFGVILVGLLIPALIVFANGNRLHRKYWRAVRQLQSGDYRDAVAGLDYCLERRPHDAEGLWKLSIARFYVGDYPGALQAFEASLDLADRDPWDNAVVWRDHLRARADGTQPVGIVARWVACYGWRQTPGAYAKARSLMYASKGGDRRFSEAAELLEACLGKMHGTRGDADALWGMAIARFHAGDLEGAIEALDRIRADWGKEPSEEFEAVVEYVKSCVPGEPPPLGMPLVLRAAATYEEHNRQTGAAEERW